MAMSNCKECGKAVSTLAKTCPKCGVPKPASKLKIKKKAPEKFSMAKKPFDEEPRIEKLFFRLAPVGVVFAIAVSKGFFSWNTNFQIVVGFVILLYVLITIFATDFFG